MLHMLHEAMIPAALLVVLFISAALQAKRNRHLSDLFSLVGIVALALAIAAVFGK